MVFVVGSGTAIDRLLTAAAFSRTAVGTAVPGFGPTGPGASPGSRGLRWNSAESFLMRSRGISSPDCIAAQKRPACFSSLSMVSGLFVHRQPVTPDRAVRRA